MTIVAVTGDCATTTSLALAATWPQDAGVDGDELVMVVEADPDGGCLAGWLDAPATPSLATIVAATGSDGRVLQTIATMVHHTVSGIDVVTCPPRALAAHRAVDEAGVDVLPALARADVLGVTDVGRHRPGGPAAALELAATIVLVHRQRRDSPGAAAVRLERLAESVEMFGSTSSVLVLALIGDRPFDPGEIVSFVDGTAPGAVDGVVTIADDPLSAAVLAGRRGTSKRRMQRLPLLRSAGRAAVTIRDLTYGHAELLPMSP